MNTQRIQRLLSLFSIGIVTAIPLVTASAASATTAPSNDEPAGAVNVGALPFIDTIDTSGATAGTITGTNTRCKNFGSLWYVLHATSDKALSISTAGSSYDTTLAEFTGSATDANETDCNDDGSGLQSRVVLHPTIGTTYYFMAACYSPTACGTTSSSASPATLKFIVEPVADITVVPDKKGSFDHKTGVATVTGTISCSTAMTGKFSTFVSNIGLIVPGAFTRLVQKVGRAYVSSTYPYQYPAAEFTCGPSPTHWSIQFAPNDGLSKFGGGKADLTIAAYGFSSNDPANYIFPVKVFSATVDL
jgi:hypothetical protein